jgi:peptidoglycan/xylan/chitin deacetylase (PgdA/CDA1 family)
VATQRPALVLSLDFELHWGIRDHTPVDGYRENLLGVRKAIPAMLDLFQRADVACTWATVGMLMAESKAELMKSLPDRLPRYSDPRMSPYLDLNRIGESEADDPFHYAPSLVRQILATPRQELATHTFSHFYALEPGQSAEDFSADIGAAKQMAEKFGSKTKSIVFPRNQFVRVYLDVLRKHGIRAYRSNGEHWAYGARRNENPWRRAFRLADAYVPLSGARGVRWPVAEDGLVDVEASAFLRPYSARFRRAEPLRLARLSRQLTQAAERGELFHLWWHPHNFGCDLEENIAFLRSFLEIFATLRRRYDLESLTMAEVAMRVLGNQSAN